MDAPRVLLGDNAGLPRIVWMYWAQGWTNAPDLVKECAASWQRMNPDWDVRMLNRDTLSAWVDIDISQAAWGRMGQPHRAAHVRLKLLDRYGGVWVDATCLALRPLSAWLPDLGESGFFAFRWLRGDVLRYPGQARPLRAGRERIVATWFLASTPGNELTHRWASRFTEYWEQGRFVTGRHALVQRAVDKLARRHWRLASLWLHPFVWRVLRVRPYLVLNALFTHLVLTDKDCAKFWHATPRMSAVPAHELHVIRLEPMATAAALRRIENAGTPLQKLDWRMPFGPDVSRLLRDASTPSLAD